MLCKCDSAHSAQAQQQQLLWCVRCSVCLLRQAVAYGNEILYTLYSSCPSTSSSRSSSSSSSGVCRPVNYKAETEEVLLRLEQCMECSGIAHKKLLTGVSGAWAGCQAHRGNGSFKSEPCAICGCTV